MKPDPYWGAQNPQDMIIAELDIDGNILKQTTVATLAGLGAGNLGSAIEPDNLRYSLHNNTLFVGVNDEDTTNPATAYEIDVELSTIVATYTGPNISAPFRCLKPGHSVS